MPALRELDHVVLLKDLPEAGLRAGDVGAIVQVHGSNAVDVEFVPASGRTVSVETLGMSDVRPVRDDELLTVRPSFRAAARPREGWDAAFRSMAGHGDDALLDLNAPASSRDDEE